MDDTATIDRLLDERLRSIQIINAALLTGVVVFIGCVLLVMPGDKPPVAAREPPMLAYAAIAFSAVALLAWAIVPARIVGEGVAKIAAGTWVPATRTSAPQDCTTDTAKLLAVYTIKSIIGAALLEGPAFFAGVVFMKEHHWFALGIIAGAVLLMLVTFPTRGRVRGWIESNLISIDEQRQFGGKSPPAS